jgi:hypothetical protein
MVYCDEDELGPTGVEGATDQPPGAGAPGGLRGELHRFPREGLGMPLSHFMRVLLHYYGVELHHLAPNFVS